MATDSGPTGYRLRRLSITRCGEQYICTAIVDTPRGRVWPASLGLSRAEVLAWQANVLRMVQAAEEESAQYRT